MLNDDDFHSKIEYLWWLYLRNNARQRIIEVIAIKKDDVMCNEVMLFKFVLIYIQFTINLDIKLYKDNFVDGFFSISDYTNFFINFC